jgi:hypothetical protein
MLESTQVDPNCRYVALLGDPILSSAAPHANLQPKGYGTSVVAPQVPGFVVVPPVPGFVVVPPVPGFVLVPPAPGFVVVPPVREPPLAALVPPVALLPPLADVVPPVEDELPPVCLPPVAEIDPPVPDAPPEPIPPAAELPPAATEPPPAASVRMPPLPTLPPVVVDVSAPPLAPPRPLVADIVVPPVEVPEEVSSDPEPEAQAKKKIPSRAETGPGLIRGRRVGMRAPWTMQASFTMEMSSIRRYLQEFQRGFVFNFPKSEISFVASGFVQELRAAPIESPQQFLGWEERQRCCAAERQGVGQTP